MILLADDDRAARTLTAGALAPLGQELRVADTGQAAIEALETDPAIRLLLLDWNMPRGHGRDVLGYVRRDERLRAMPVIVVTTSEAERDRTEAERLGVEGYVHKSPDFDAFERKLLAAVSPCLEGASAGR